MCGSQRTSGRCAWAKPDVLNVVAAMRLTNAHAKSEQLVIRLTNFVFISLISFCLVFLVLAFFGFSLLPPSPRLRRAKELSFLAVR
jgi:hypothetical protein